MDIKLIDRTLGELTPGTRFSLTPGSSMTHMKIAGISAEGNPFCASFHLGVLDGSMPANTPVYTERKRPSFGQLQTGTLFIGGGRYCIKAENPFWYSGITRRESYNAITTEGNFVRFEDSTEVTPIAGPLEIKY